MSGDGIPLDALDFFEELAAENTRTWWQAHRARWEESVREPMEWLTEALTDEFGAAHLYRPQRDVRFSRDTSPYKDHQGALAATVPGVGWYVQVSAAGLMTGGGFYPTGPDQTARYRAAVDAPATGQALEAVVDGSWARAGRPAARPSPPGRAASRPTTRAWTSCGTSTSWCRGSTAPRTGSRPTRCSTTCAPTGEPSGRSSSG